MKCAPKWDRNGDRIRTERTEMGTETGTQLGTRLGTPLGTQLQLGTQSGTELKWVWDPIGDRIKMGWDPIGDRIKMGWDPIGNPIARNCVSNLGPKMGPGTELFLYNIYIQRTCAHMNYNEKQTVFISVPNWVPNWVPIRSPIGSQLGPSSCVHKE